MESNCTVMTLKDGEFRLPFVNHDRLANDIEEKTGILAIDQIYMSSGHQISKYSIGEPDVNNLQVFKVHDYSARYFITIETGTVKVYLKVYKYRIIHDLFIEFENVCKKHNLKYPINEYAFYFKRKILPLATPMSTIPPDSQIILVKDNIYSSGLKDSKDIITLELRCANNKIFSMSLDRRHKLKYLLDFISMFNGLDRDKVCCGARDYIYSQIKYSNHTIESLFKDREMVFIYDILSGGGPGVNCPASFSFNSMNNAVHIEFNKNAPKWRIVQKGVSWQGICVNPICEAVNQKVICNCGLGVFDVDKQILKTKCPMCKKNIISVSGCGFYSCDYEFYGTLKNGKELEGKGKAGNGNGNYTSFLDGEKLEWVFMRIQVISSDLKLYY